MPKMKTKSSAAKRFRTTASGKLKRKKAYRNHIMGAKTTKQKRGLRSSGYVSKADESNMKKLLPYI